jgi:hypothetical protein
MQLKTVDILSTAVGKLGTNPTTGTADGVFDDFGKLNISRGTLLTFSQPITDYLWVEFVFTSKVQLAGTVATVEVNTVEGEGVAVFNANVSTDQGLHSENSYKVSYVGPITEVAIRIGPNGAVVQLSAIRVAKFSDNLTITNAVTTQRGSLTNLGGLVYNAVLGCYEGDLVPNIGGIFPNVNFVGLIKDKEFGVVRYEFVGNNGQLAAITAAPDGYFATVSTPKGKLVFSGDGTLNVYPVAFAINNGGPAVAHIRIYVELYAFVDSNVSAFGLSVQSPTTQPPSSYNPISGLASLVGFLYATGAAISAYALIPVQFVDFTTAVVPLATINTLAVTNTGTINDLKVTRTGIAYANQNGSIYIKDPTAYVTPTDADKFGYRVDLTAFNIGTPLTNGALVTLDASVTGSGGIQARYGIRMFARPTSVQDAGIYGVYTDLNAANAAYTLPFIYHHHASASFAAGSATITEVRGYNADNSIAKGATNTGFYSNINNATNTFQMALAGTAPSYIGSELGLGSSVTGTGGSQLFITMAGNPLLAVTDKIGVSIRNVSTSSMVGNVIGVQLIGIGSANVAYTLGNLSGFWAQSFTKGAASTITTVFGFRVSNAIAVGSTNYGFWSDINTATNTFQLGLTGTAPSYTNSQFGFGGQPATTDVVTINTNVGTLAGTSQFGARVGNSFNAAAIGNAVGFATDLQTLNSVVTYNALIHFWAKSTTRGASSTITTLYGFCAINAIATGSTNYGFYSDISSATNTWQSYMGGTALSYFASPIQMLSTISGNFDVLIRLGSGATHPSGSVSVYGTHQNWKSPATATSGMYGHYTNLSTTVAVYNTAEITHYRAGTTTLGAGSTANYILGFYAPNAMVGAVNNVSAGFYSDINFATNTYQAYMGGTGYSYFGGNTGINFFPTSANTLIVGPPANLGASATNLALYNPSGITSTVSAQYWGVYSSLGTTAAVFTLPTLVHYYAQTTTLGAGSAITNVFAFKADTAALNKGTNNFAFWTDVGAASGTYAFRAAGTAKSRFDGPLGFSIDPASSTILHANPAPLSAAGSVVYYVGGIFASTVITTALGFQAQLQSANVAVTYAEVTGFRVDGWTKGAASTITNACGFRVEDNFAVGTNSFAFYSNIADGTTWTNKFNFYAPNTARNLFTGPLGLGSNNVAGWTTNDRFLFGFGTLNQATSYGCVMGVTGGSGNITALNTYWAYGETTAAAYTLTDLRLYYASQIIKGAGSTITNGYGLYVDAAVGGKATNTYGMRSDLAAAANTFNLYCGGTADNAVAGAFYFAKETKVIQATAAMYAGSGVPNNANGNNGDYYFRSDTPGTAAQRLYVKSAGVWVGVV